MILQQKLEAHVMQLAGAIGILIEHNQRPIKAYLKYYHAIRLISVPKVRGTISYAVALHELGHAYTFEALGNSYIERINKLRTEYLMYPRNLNPMDPIAQDERNAWEWAKRNALLWTPSMEWVANKAIGTYYKS